MPGFRKRIQPVVDFELDAARSAMLREDPAAAFSHLERAHVLGQQSTLLHVRVHWRMFLWGLRQCSPREVLGQALRLVAAAAATPIGLVPLGNTGGSSVSPVSPMPIPLELLRLIDAARG